MPCTQPRRIRGRSVCSCRKAAHAAAAAGPRPPAPPSEARAGLPVAPSPPAAFPIPRPEPRLCAHRQGTSAPSAAIPRRGRPNHNRTKRGRTRARTHARTHVTRARALRSTLRRRTPLGFSFCPAPRYYADARRADPSMFSPRTPAPALRRRTPPGFSFGPSPRYCADARRPGPTSSCTALHRLVPLARLRHIRLNPPRTAAGDGRPFRVLTVSPGMFPFGTPSTTRIPLAHVSSRNLPRPEWRGPARCRRPLELTRLSPQPGGAQCPRELWRFAVKGRFHGVELCLHASSAHSVPLSWSTFPCPLRPIMT